MNAQTRFYILGAVLILSFVSCSTWREKNGWFDGEIFSGDLFSGSIFKGDSPLFEKPPEKILFSDKDVFNQALELHQKGQVQTAIQLWKKFIDQQPKSFEAFNNLGMSYYANDNLDSAVECFESALKLKPSNKKIRDNLIRTLQFRSTLFKENKEHPKAVADLQKIGALADPITKEKILKEIEQEQDIIYKQVKQTNTIPAYKVFAKQYPNSIFAEKAKARIAKLAPQPTDRNKFENRPVPPRSTQGKQPGKPRISPGVIPMPKAEGYMNKEKMVEKSASFPVSPASTSLTPKAGKPSPGREKNEQAASVPPKNHPKIKPLKVKITTETTPLNVRKAPSTKSPIIGKVTKGTTHSVLEEKESWFLIVYSKGKATGWISKQFSQIVE